MHTARNAAARILMGPPSECPPGTLSISAAPEPDLAELWRTQQHATFPASCLPLSVDGVKLVKLDAAAGAILTAALRTDGVVRRLDDAKLRDLERHRDLIRKALREAALDAEGRSYFDRLAALADVVLKG
jgi:hypothetical protein